MLKILSTSSDGQTGHISINAQVVETVGNNTTAGAVETHGIHPLQLQRCHGGDVKGWLRSVHTAMLRRHEDRKLAAVAMQSLHGITIFEDEENTNGTQHQA